MAPYRPKATREGSPHRRNYITFYLSPAVVAELDELKARWRIPGRGKVIERLVHAALVKEKETYSEADLESRI